MATTVAASRKHVELSLELKRKLIQEHEHGVPFTLLGKKYHIATSTAANIWRKKDFFLRSRMSGSRKRCNDRSKYKIVNQVTALFVKSMLERNHKIDGEVIKRFARTAAAQCNFKDFHGSNGWLDSFKKRENVCWVRRRGDRSPGVLGASSIASSSSLATLSGSSLATTSGSGAANTQNLAIANITANETRRSDSPNLSTAAAAAAVAASANQHDHHHHHHHNHHHHNHQLQHQQHEQEPMQSGCQCGPAGTSSGASSHCCWEEESCPRCTVAAAAAAIAALNSNDSVHERDHEIEDWFHGIPFLCQFFEEYQNMHQQRQQQQQQQQQQLQLQQQSQAEINNFQNAAQSCRYSSCSLQQANVASAATTPPTPTNTMMNEANSCSSSSSSSISSMSSLLANNNGGTCINNCKYQQQCQQLNTRHQVQSMQATALTPSSSPTSSSVLTQQQQQSNLLQEQPICSSNSADQSVGLLFMQQPQYQPQAFHRSGGSSADIQSMCIQPATLESDAQAAQQQIQRTMSTDMLADMSQQQEVESRCQEQQQYGSSEQLTDMPQQQYQDYPMTTSNGVTQEQQQQQQCQQQMMDINYGEAEQQIKCGGLERQASSHQLLNLLKSEPAQQQADGCCSSSSCSSVNQHPQYDNQQTGNGLMIKSDYNSDDQEYFMRPSTGAETGLEQQQQPQIPHTTNCNNQQLDSLQKDELSDHQDCCSEHRGDSADQGESLAPANMQNYRAELALVGVGGGGGCGRCCDNNLTFRGNNNTSNTNNSHPTCYMDEYEYENISTIRHYPLPVTAQTQLSSQQQFVHSASSNGRGIDLGGDVCDQQQQLDQSSPPYAESQLQATSSDSSNHVVNNQNQNQNNSQEQYQLQQQQQQQPIDYDPINGLLYEHEQTAEHADHEEHNMLHNALMRSPEKLKLIESIITLLNYASNFNPKMLGPLLEIKRCIERDLEVVLSDTTSLLNNNNQQQCCNLTPARPTTTRDMNTQQQQPSNDLISTSYANNQQRAAGSTVQEQQRRRQARPPPNNSGVTQHEATETSTTTNTNSCNGTSAPTTTTTIEMIVSER